MPTNSMTLHLKIYMKEALNVYNSLYDSFLTGNKGCKLNTNWTLANKL